MKYNWEATLYASIVRNVGILNINTFLNIRVKVELEKEDDNLEYS